MQEADPLGLPCTKMICGPFESKIHGYRCQAIGGASCELRGLIAHGPGPFLLSLHQLGHRAHQFPQYVTFLALSCCFFLPLGTARQQEQQKKERSRPLQSHAAALTIESHCSHLQGLSALVLRLRSAAALPPPLCKGYQHKQVSLNLCSVGWVGVGGWMVATFIKGK